MLALLDKAGIEPGNRLHGDKAYGSRKHREALKARGEVQRSQSVFPASIR
jgi:IS5 family transposase